MDSKKKYVYPCAAALLGIIAALAAVLLFPAEMDDPGGRHVWLSTSTANFVNIWLEKGPVGALFTNFNNYPSVELTDDLSREPYCSYPTGHTFMVYLIAVLSGKKTVGLAFVKHTAQAFFLADTGLLSLFFFLLMKRITGEEVKSVIFSSVWGAIWAFMPIDTYYLQNSFFTDQSVIFWIFLLWLTEYIRSDRDEDKFLFLFHCFIVVCGVLDDYYFWIQIFLFFVIRSVHDILTKNRYTLRNACGYVISVFAGLGVFLLQLVQNVGWWEQLRFKFIVRSAMNEDDPNGLINSLVWNFGSAYSQGNGILFCVMFFGGILLTVLTGLYIIKEKKLGKLFLCPEYSVPLGAFSGVLLQILVLRNHSAVHEFAFIKFSAFIILVIPMTAVLSRNYIFIKGDGRRVLAVTAAAMTAAVILITGIPYYDSRYISDRSGTMPVEYETVIGENTDFYDLAVTTEERYSIGNTPPVQYLYSKKLVYLVKDGEEIRSRFPDLPDRARIVLVLHTGDDLPPWAVQKDIRYEDGSISLVEIELA